MCIWLIGKRADMGTELELPGQPNRDSMEPAPRAGTERPNLMMAREPAVAYHPVASEWRPPRTLWEWVGENAEHVADAGVVLVCLIVYASLEGGHPRSTFLISSLMYQYSYPLKVRSHQRPLPTSSDEVRPPHEKSSLDMSIVKASTAMVCHVRHCDTFPRHCDTFPSVLPLFARRLAKTQTVPSWAVPPLAFLAPTACFSYVTWRNGRPRSELIRLIVSLGIALLLTGAVTNALKLALSRPRPNFVVACGSSDTPILQGGSSYGGYPQVGAVRWLME